MHRVKKLTTLPLMSKYVIISVTCLFCVFILSGCAPKIPSLKKFGWELVEEDQLDKHLSKKMFQELKEGTINNSVLFVQNEDDYLICDKPSFYDKFDFCWGYMLCREASKGHGCAIGIYQSWMDDE